MNITGQGIEESAFNWMCIAWADVDCYRRMSKTDGQYGPAPCAGTHVDFGDKQVEKRTRQAVSDDYKRFIDIFCRPEHEIFMTQVILIGSSRKRPKCRRGQR